MKRLLGLLLCLVSGVAFAGPEADLDALSRLDVGYEDALAAAVANPALSDAALALLSESADWRLRQQAEVLLVWRETPAAARAASRAEPRPTRAGTLRFQDPSLEVGKVAPVLVDRLMREPEPLRREALADVVARQPDLDPRVLAGLIGAEPDPAVRATLVWGWRDHADGEAALAGLRSALEDPDARVRANAAAATGYRPNGAALAGELVKSLDDSSPEVRALAARSLGWLQVPGAFAPLVKLLDDSQADVRLAALRALERIDAKGASALPELTRLSADADPRVAKAAAAMRP